MAWYYVAVMILGFFAIVWLGIKGVFGKSTVSLISKITSGLSVLSASIAAATENRTIDVIALVIQLVEKAVLAAENAYYNSEITADERYSTCMKYFDQMLVAASVTLTDSQQTIIDALIKAACESMGHTTEINSATD